MHMAVKNIPREPEIRWRLPNAVLALPPQGLMQPGVTGTLMPSDSLPIAPGAEDALSQMTRAAPLLQVCARHNA